MFRGQPLDCTVYEVRRRTSPETTEMAGEARGGRKEADPGGQSLPDRESHTLEFQDVSFVYPGSERMVLEHVGLRLSGGERVALVGPNGSGKSTLIKLICRLYEPVSGRILLDGVDIREISREAQRQYYR